MSGRAVGPLLPWWARLVLGAGIGTAWARVRALGIPRFGIEDVVLLAVAGAIFAAIAELARPRFRLHVPLAGAAAVAIGALPALSADIPELLLFVIPLYFGAFALADAPPVEGAGRIAVSRGGGRDLYVPIALLSTMGMALAAAIGMAFLFTAWRVNTRGALGLQVVAAAVGAALSFALQVSGDIVRRAGGPSPPAEPLIVGPRRAPGGRAPSAPRPLAPWWARLAMGAAAGTAWARLQQAMGTASPEAALALTLAAAAALAAIAELGRPRFRAHVPGACLLAVAAVGAMGTWGDSMWLLLVIPVFFGTFALAAAPPVPGGGMRVSRGGLRDLQVPLAAVVGMVGSWVGGLLLAESVWSLTRSFAPDLRWQVQCAVVGAVSSFALQGATWLVARAAAPPPRSQERIAPAQPPEERQ